MTARKAAKEKVTPNTKAKTVLELCFRFIKLSNGEDIICQIPMGIETEALVIVRHPIKVTAVNAPGSEDQIYSLVPWIVFSDQELFPVNKIAILSISTIKESVKLLYLQRVAEYLEVSPSEEVEQLAPLTEVDEEEDAAEKKSVKKKVDKKVWLN